MKRLLFYVSVSLLTASLGIALKIWIASRHLTPTAPVNVPLKISNDKDDVSEIVFRDLMRRYPSPDAYFLSFNETDPSDDFMLRFKDNPRIKKLSQAIRKENQVTDGESSLIGVKIQVNLYYPVSESQVKVGGFWELSELGKKPRWITRNVEYQLQKTDGKWVIMSSRLLAPIH